MGGVVLLGGGVLLAALLLKGKDEIHQNQTQTVVAGQVQSKDSSSNTGMTQLQPLTVDVETEKRLLAEQKRAREKAVAEQEARAAEFLAMQQQAEADAARKAAEEYAALNARKVAAQQSSDNIPPELVEDEKAKQKRLHDEKLAAEKKQAQQKAETLKAKQASLDAEKKAAAEKKALQEKKRLDETRQATEKKQAAEKKKAEEAKKKAEAEKARDLLEHGDKQWMVQVALAANQANADAMAAKLRAKGYKVTKSPTSKGIRLMVGPSKNRDAADSIRKKVAADDSLGMKSAWIIEWVPLDKR